MKSTLFVLTLAATLSITGLAYAQSADETAAPADQAVMAEQPAPVNVGNKICPVSGQSVNTMGEPVTLEYNGKVYNLCCADCKGKFLAEAEKYSAIAEEEAAAEVNAAPAEVMEAAPVPAE